jgi:plasmid stability protein
MKSLHIRDVPEPTIARLKRRALLHHRSLQGELIFVLEEAARQIPQEEPAEFSLNTVRTNGTQNWSREAIYESDDLQILATAAAGGMHTLLTANEKDFPKNASIAIAPLSELEW